VRKLRTEKGLSLRQVSNASGLSKGYLSNVERGLGQIGNEALHLIAAAIGVPPMDLLCFPEDDCRSFINESIRPLPPRALAKLLRELAMLAPSP